MFYRDCEKNLKIWYQNTNSKPLVIRGARQVGKTSLVRSFCQKNKISLVEINFEETKVHSFANDNFSIEAVLQEIEILKNTKINKNSILFLDEIQVIPKAYQALRFFKEQRPDLKVVAAGSLLEMVLKQEKISTPVGRVEFLYLYPMTFNEYLLAQNERQLVKTIKSKQAFPQSIHAKILQYLNHYFYIGGMPEAVKLFISGSSFNEIRKVHLDIIESYRQDIRKYYQGSSKNILLEAFDSTFSNLGEKVKYSKFSKAKSTIVAECLNTLADLFLIHKVIHSNCSGKPIQFGQNLDYYKIFFIDIGLYNSILNTPWKMLYEEEFNALINKGVIAEQFVAQELVASNHRSKNKIHYWLKDKDPKKSEVDFIFDTETSVYAIEVKSGKAGKIKSLIQFMGEKKELKPEAIKLDLKFRENFTQEYTSFYFTKTGKKKVSFTLHELPLYMARFILNSDI